jgi:adenylate kinase
VFNVLTLCPRVEGVCDQCNSKLIIRPDDNPDTIKNRLDVYRVESAPVLDYYRSRSLVSDVDGVGTVSETDVEIDAVLAGLRGE